MRDYSPTMRIYTTDEGPLPYTPQSGPRRAQRPSIPADGSHVDITVAYDKDGNLVTLGGLREVVRQEVARALYAILSSEIEADIATLSAEQFEALCARVKDEECAKG